MKAFLDMVVGNRLDFCHKSDNNTLAGTMEAGIWQDCNIVVELEDTEEHKGMDSTDPVRICRWWYP